MGHLGLITEADEELLRLAVAAKRGLALAPMMDFDAASGKGASGRVEGRPAALSNSGFLESATFVVSGTSYGNSNRSSPPPEPTRRSAADGTLGDERPAYSRSVQRR